MLLKAVKYNIRSVHSERILIKEFSSSGFDYNSTAPLCRKKKSDPKRARKTNEVYNNRYINNRQCLKKTTSLDHK